jgi:hypothetical protein
MALKNNDPKGGGNGKGKVTVVMFQLEGSDDALRDAIKVLGHGIEKLAPGAPVYKMIQAPPLAKVNGGLPPGRAAEEEMIEEEAIEPADGGEFDEDTSSSSQRDGSEKPRKRNPPKAIPAVKGIDWDSETSWRDYAVQKNPDGNPSRFVVAAGWFRNIRSLNVITPGHIVAAIRRDGLAEAREYP